MLKGIFSHFFKVGKAFQFAKLTDVWNHEFLFIGQVAFLKATTKQSISSRKFRKPMEPLGVVIEMMGKCERTHLLECTKS